MTDSHEQRIRVALERAAELMLSLKHALQHAKADDTPKRLVEMEEQLTQLELDRQDLTARIVEAERQADRLIALYVAAYQLHASLDPDAVRDSIADITTNLLGAGRFRLLLQTDAPRRWEVALAVGAPDEAPAAAFYEGGDPCVDRALAEGLLQLGNGVDEPLAAVPLNVQGTTVGALVVEELLAHKTTPLADDRELLDLLGAHAGSALVAARAHATVRRKLRTLEALTQLVRPGG